MKTTPSTRAKALAPARAIPTPGFMEYPHQPGSLRFDAGSSDELRPLVGKLIPQLAEFANGYRDRRCAKLRKSSSDAGIVQSCIYLLVEQGDDLCWCTFWGNKA